MECFYQNILALHQRFTDAGKDVVFVANIPASEQIEKDGADYWRVFHMNDVNDLYRKAQKACNFAFISFYELLSAYCEREELPLDTLLGDGLHPNDRGYDVMFELLTAALGFATASREVGCI